MKLNAIMTGGIEAARHNKVSRIRGTGHGDDLLEYRTHTVWLKCIRCTTTAHFPGLLDGNEME
jgi:hypothetical protein